MKYIYVKDYMDLTKNEKVKFFIFFKNFTECLITRQRIVLGENSLLLDFPEKTDIEKIKKLIERYLKVQKNVSVAVVKHIREEDDHQILEFEDKQIRI